MYGCYLLRALTQHFQQIKHMKLGWLVIHKEWQVVRSIYSTLVHVPSKTVVAHKGQQRRRCLHGVTASRIHTSDICYGPIVQKEA